VCVSDSWELGNWGSEICVCQIVGNWGIGEVKLVCQIFGNWGIEEAKYV